MLQWKEREEKIKSQAFSSTYSSLHTQIDCSQEDGRLFVPSLSKGRHSGLLWRRIRVLGVLRRQGDAGRTVRTRMHG